MCGIVGFISQENFNSFKELLPEAALHLSHRGPDDSGFFLADLGKSKPWQKK
jgi:asparagine synthetase B (glutamine-hydrolysing)